MKEFKWTMGDITIVVLAQDQAEAIKKAFFFLSMSPDYPFADQLKAEGIKW